MRISVAVVLAVVMAGAGLGLCQCDGKKGQSVKMYEKVNTFPALDAAMAFDVQVDMTAAAAKTVKAQGLTLVADTAYYGLPTAASMPRANALHEIDLGSEHFGLGTEHFGAEGVTTKLHFSGALDRSQLKDIVNGTPYVFVTLDAGESVACSSYRGSIAQAQVTGAAVMHCDLAKP